MDRLKELRLARGSTQREVSEFLGVTNQTYSNYETGKREPDHETLLMLADYFNVTTDYLLGRTDKPGEEVSANGDDVKVALFGGDGEVTDEMWNDVMSFVEFIKTKRQREKKDGES